MSLKITLISGSKQEWTLGNDLQENVSRVVDMITADGEELKHIKNQYRLNNTSIYFSIPLVKHCKEMTWSGDIARTIVANLNN